MSICIVRFPRPLLAASSAVSPPREYMFMTTVGDVVIRLTSRIVPFSSSVRTTCDAGLASTG